MFSFNSKIGSLSYSPFQLLYGYQPQSVIQNLILPAAEPSEGPRQHRYLHKEKLDEIRHLTTSRQLKQWEKRMQKYQAGLRKHQYHVGDLILFQNYAKRGKPGSPWDDKWRGPAKITHISTKGKIPDHSQYRGRHTDRIKPFIFCNFD
ncbi:hypothetical protein BDZ91DRAFT_717717 [Kalaharituber pfeilii]|nr:hypothetical protein BDZ91DRAFT_717717 [Kalaharituber pfeilii]